MYTRIKQTLLLLASLILWSAGQAQTVPATLKKINQAYSQPGTLRTQMSYRYFIRETDTRPESEVNAQITIKGKTRYMTVGNMEDLRNERYRVMVDHDSRIMVIDEVQQAPADGMESMLYAPDSLLKLCSRYTYRQTANNEICVLHFNGMAYTRIEFYSNPATHLVNKIVVFFSPDYPDPDYQGGRLEIVCTRTERNPDITAGLFSESRYFSGKAPSYQPVAAYKSYRLLHATDKQH